MNNMFIIQLGIGICAHKAFSTKSLKIVFERPDGKKPSVTAYNYKYGQCYVQSYLLL